MLKIRRDKLDTLSNTRAMTNPMNVIDDRRMLTGMLTERLVRAEENCVQKQRSELAKEAGRLDALNPLSVIARGYSAVYKTDGKLVKSIDDVTPGDQIEFKTLGGAAVCTVDEVNKTGN